MKHNQHRTFHAFLVATLVASFLFLFPSSLLAAEAGSVDSSSLGTFNASAGLGDQDIRVTIGSIVQVVLGFLGIIAVLIVLYAGFLWMTAGGNEDQILKAKKFLINGGVGLLIILSAFSITTFVLSKLGQATEGSSGDGLGSGGNIGGGFKGGAGQGKTIESHYPERNEKNVPRNAPVVITFKMPIDPASLMKVPAGKTSPIGTPQDVPGGQPLYDELRPDAIELYPISGGNKDKPLAEKKVVNVHVSMTPDKKTFLFEPVDLLGSSLEDTQYTVHLTSAILTVAGKPLFESAKDEYEWSFTVSTLVDTTPPKVVSAFPSIKTTKEQPRNIAVLITFNEPIFPISATGKTKEGFTNVVVGELKTGNTLTPILGTFRITNAYRTIEFQADDPSNLCGKNACGKEVYCLPPSAKIQILAKAATLKKPGSGDPAALVNLLAAPSTLGLNGIVDMAKNSLDGGGENGSGSDGKSGGPPDDNFYFGFATSANKDLEAPRIQSIGPSPLEQNVKLDAQPTFVFSKPMLYSTFGNAMLYANPASLAVGFNKKFNELPMDAGNPAAEFYETKTQAVLYHGSLFAKEGTYSPHVPSSVTDVAYNCFYPAKDAATCKGTTPEKPWCCNGNPSASACIPAGQ